MPGIGVINNPRSKKNKRHPERMKRLSYLLGAGGTSATTWSFEDLDAVMEEFKRQRIDILAINGGDGSNHVTLSHMVRIYGDQPLPMVTLLRGGTLNTQARSFGIQGSTEWLLYNLQEKYAAGETFETVRHPLMRIGDDYGFLFGNGVIANYMETYYSTGTPSPSHGAKVLAKGVVSVIFGTDYARAWMQPVKAKVTIDDEEVLPYESYLTMGFGSMREIGIGFSPWPRCLAQPGCFHAVFFLGSPFAIVRDLPYIYYGRAIHPRVAEERVARSVRLEASHPFAYTIDGDMYTCQDGRLTISTGPELTIIRK